MYTVDSVKLGIDSTQSSGAISQDKNTDSHSPSGLTDLVICPTDMPARSRKAFLQHMVDNLPKSLQNRIMALKDNQMQQIKISEQFFREVYKLERHFYIQTCMLLDARRDIVDGTVEPPIIERYWHEEPDEIVEEIKATEEFQQLIKQTPTIPENVKGVPRFWLTVFRNVATISDLIQQHDEPLLSYLHDIRISYSLDSYTIIFSFQPNEYLHNTSLMLTKKYYLRHEADKDYPFLFEGPEIVRCEGCNIHWRDGSNLTLQTVEHKRSRKRSKVMPRESFFRFFSPPQILDLSLADEKTKMVLGNDFEVGYVLRTQIVPKAVLFYTGDMVDNMYDEPYPDASSMSSC